MLRYSNINTCIASYIQIGPNDVALKSIKMKQSALREVLYLIRVIRNVVSLSAQWQVAAVSSKEGRSCIYDNLHMLRQSN